MRRILSYYHPKLPIYIVYMLQQVDYEHDDFLEWLERFPNLTRVMYRKSLVFTAKVKLLVVFNYLIAAVFFAVAYDFAAHNLLAGVGILLLIPFFVISFFYALVYFAWIFIERPRRVRQINKSERILKNHPAKIIAIAGSYGKTSMKEMLFTIIGQNKKVAMTPGNKNVAISHARWAQKLDGNEDILLIEYGEGRPGDISKFAANTNPDMGIITGAAPNHLDKYISFDNVINDLLSLGEFVDSENLYINGNDPSLQQKAKNLGQFYSDKSALGWKVSDIKISIEGTSFKMTKSKKNLTIKSALLGRHQIGPQALAAALGDQFGLTKVQIESNFSRLTPYEHRMQPRNLNGGWIIDDTYNGSLEGFRAGLTLLNELKAKRKIYVTPGLVDQGEETENVHKEIGRLIAEANPNKVVLINNSVCSIIKNSMETHNFSGQLEIVDESLEYYSNLDHFIAAGDIWLLQNDWTDNYF